MLKLLLACALIALPCHADPAAVHGMLLFGHDSLYISHLPMFHPPHDYQAIFEVELSPQSKAAYLKDAATYQAADPSLYYTLVPEPFVLPDLGAHPKPFHATIFRGHFERGGTSILEDALVNVTKVIYFKKLDPATVTSEDTYLLFGSPSESFLAHNIGGAPNFDQIIEVDTPAQVTDEVQTVTFPGIPQNTPLTAPTLLTTKDGLSVDIKRVLYLELGDLAS